MPTVFEVRRADGVLQLDIASSLPQTLGVIIMKDYLESNNQFASGTIYIPQWVGKRGWWAYEGIITETSIWCPTIYRTGDSLYFRIGRVSSTTTNNPRIKYGVY